MARVNFNNFNVSVILATLRNFFPVIAFNPFYAELNPICHFLALLGAHHILHASRIRVNAESNKFYFLLT